MRAAASALLASLVASCTPETRIPGSEVMGTFELTARRSGGDCSHGEIPDTVSFRAVFSREPATSEAFLTKDGISSLGTFDGQTVRITQSAPRRFEACACETTVLEETLIVALLSRAQDEALGGRCPEDALDGGIPAEVDGGSARPGSTPAGFDALRACGVLLDRVAPGEGCRCAPCTFEHRVEGERR